MELGSCDQVASFDGLLCRNSVIMLKFWGVSKNRLVLCDGKLRISGCLCLISIVVILGEIQL